ncbi:MAG TPA: hypothetical protein VF117_07950 [Gammaproteobacteria bacterium]
MHASPEQLIALRDGEPVDAAVQAHTRVCAECAAEFNTLVEMRAMLARLPEFAPPDGAWAAVLARVEHGDAIPEIRPQRLRAASIALVASIVIAVMLAMFPGMRKQSSDTTTVGSVASASVPQLVLQSRYLESAVLSLNASTDHMVISAGTAATVAALEDRIALVDYEINHAAVNPGDRSRLPQLWQQRVNLLQSLAAVRYAQAANGTI